MYLEQGSQRPSLKKFNGFPYILSDFFFQIPQMKNIIEKYL